MALHDSFSCSSESLGPQSPADTSCDLLEAPCGVPLLVEELAGDGPVRSRLCALGILPGTEMEVRNNDDKDCIWVRVRHCSLILSGGMAKAIRCHRHRHGHHHHHYHCCGHHHHHAGHEHHHGHHSHHTHGKCRSAVPEESLCFGKKSS